MQITFEEIRTRVQDYLSLSETKLQKEMLETMEKAHAGSSEARKNLKEHISYFIAEQHFSKEDYISIVNSYMKEYKNYDRNLYPTENLYSNIEILSQLVYQETTGLSVIDNLVFSELDEIGVNGFSYIWIQESGFKRQVFYETKEGKTLPMQFKDNDYLINVLKSRAVSFEKTKDLNQAETSFLGSSYDGNRIKILLPPNTSKPRANFRKFLLKDLTEDEFIKTSSATKDTITFFENIFPGRPNIKVIGEPGSGKSTFLRFLVRFIDPSLSIGTLERDYELRLEDYFPDRNIHDFRESKTLTIENGFEEMLKQNRDIIITGEIATPIEQTVSLKAKIRQAKGSIDTFHSTSPTDCIYDARNLLMQSGYYSNEKIALYDVARAEDIIIQVRLDRKNKKRYIHKVSEIIEDRETMGFTEREIFKIDRETWRLKPVQMISENLIEKLLDFECTKENIDCIEQIFK